MVKEKLKNPCSHMFLIFSPDCKSTFVFSVPAEADCVLKSASCNSRGLKLGDKGFNKHPISH